MDKNKQQPQKQNPIQNPNQKQQQQKQTPGLNKNPNQKKGF